MAVATGLVLKGHRSLPEICTPVADELARCFCVIDTGAGPFDSSWLYASPQNDALVRGLYWDVPALADSSTHGFRPGPLPAVGCPLR